MLVSDMLIPSYLHKVTPELEESALIQHLHFILSNLPIIRQPR